MKSIKQCISVVVMLWILLFCQSIFVLAAEGSVTYGSTSYTATQGENFQVGVYVKGSEAIGAYEFYLDYNPDMIEYVSGADSGGAGRLKFVGYGNADSYSYMLTFRAISAGNCNISISGADLGPLNPSSGDSMTITEASSAPVTIQGPQTASEDCDLSSLMLSPSGLYGFSPDVTEYDITVAYDVNKLSVSATTSNEKATYTVSDTNLDVGVNTISITVTAESGATKTYSIIVRRKPEETTAATTTSSGQTETTTQRQAETTASSGQTEAATTASGVGLTSEEMEQAVSFFVNGKDMFVSKAPDSDSIPKGFSETTVSYQEKEIPAYSGGSQNITLFYMVDGLKSNGGFYVYDVTKNSVYPYITLENTEGSYLLLLAEGITAPAGYTATTITLAGTDSESVQTNVSAWVSDSDAEFFLVYALNPNGDTGFYQYDTKEKTVQRYHANEKSSSSSGNEEGDMEELKEALAASRKENKESSKTHFMIIITLAILCIILLFTIIGMVFKIRGLAGSQEAFEETPNMDLIEPENIPEVSVPDIRKEKKLEKIPRSERLERTENLQKTEKVQKSQKPSKKKEPDFAPDLDDEIEFELDDDFEFFDDDEDENK